LHSSDEPDELLQLLHHNDSTVMLCGVSFVLVVVVLQTSDEKSPIMVQVYVMSHTGKAVNIPLQVLHCGVVELVQF